MYLAGQVSGAHLFVCELYDSVRILHLRDLSTAAVRSLARLRKGLLGRAIGRDASILDLDTLESSDEDKHGSASAETKLLVNSADEV